MKTSTGTAITAALDDVTWQVGLKGVRSLKGLGRFSKEVLFIISDGRFTTMGDPTDVASRLTDDFNVEIYSIAIGDPTYTKGFNTMRNLASHIENENHFFAISNDEDVFRDVMYQMINKEKLKLNYQYYFKERDILQRNIYVHPEYNEENKPKKLYDIALVKLDKRIDRIPDLLPVCLWDKTIEDKTRVTYDKLFTEKYGVVSGWGKRNMESTKYAGTLKQMQMEDKSSKECLENLKLREKVDVSTELMFCAGGKEKVDDKVQNIDACEGDNGGPFVFPHPLEENKLLQIGIFSFGFGCKENGRYGFFTKLTEELLSWINSTKEKEKDIG